MPTTRPNYNRCVSCLRDIQLLGDGEKPNHKYVCVDCRTQPSLSPQSVAHPTLAACLADTEFMWRSKFEMLGIKVAKRPFMARNGDVITPLYSGRALDLYLRDKPERSEEFRYSFHINLATGQWNRAGLSIRNHKLRVTQTWFNFVTLKQYTVEVVIGK